MREHEESPDLWSAMAEALKVSALGVQAPIANDTFRSSQVEMLLEFVRGSVHRPRHDLHL